MHVSELKESRFLRKEDVGEGQLVVIEKLTQENVSAEGQKERMRWCVWFKNVDKPLVLNSTNGQLIAKITGSEDSDRWAGAVVEIYNDPTISFGGKIVGGIRVRPHRRVTGAAVPASKPRTAPQPQAQPPADFDPGQDGDDDVPF